MQRENYHHIKFKWISRGGQVFSSGCFPEDGVAFKTFKKHTQTHIPFLELSFMPQASGKMRTYLRTQDIERVVIRFLHFI